MTAEELIEELKKYPPDTIVWTNISYSGKQGMVTHVTVDSLGITIDSDT